MKLHLPAKVPNEGARLVAQAILGLPCGIADAAISLQTSPARVQELVSGRLLPSLLLGRRIVRFCGATAADFEREPACGWFDRPAPVARAA